MGVLVAADALVTDHGSAALYYCAAQDRPVVSVHRGGGELIPGSPMGALLDGIPQLERAEDIAEALRAYPPGFGQAAAQAAFAPPGDAVDRLRTEVYALLGLSPPAHDVTPRHPVGTEPPGHHLAVEHGAASEKLARSAGLLYHRPLTASAAPVDLGWAADGWTRHALSAYPGCRSAAALLPSDGCLLRVRGHERTYAVQVEPRPEGDQVVRIDPAVALSAVHARMLSPSRHRTAGPY